MNSIYMEHNQEGNLILHGPSYYQKIENEKKKSRHVVSEEQIKLRKVEETADSDTGPKIDTKAIDCRKNV